MGEDGLDPDLGAVREFGEQLRQFAGHEAEPVHPGVQFDVDGEVPAALFPQDGAQFPEGYDVRDAGLQPFFNDFLVVVRPRGQDQDGEGDTGLPQFQPFDRIGDRQVIRARALHHGRELHGPVPVGIGLDQDQQLRLRFQQGSEVSVILLAVPQIELKPREIVLSVHTMHSGAGSG